MSYLRAALHHPLLMTSLACRSQIGLYSSASLLSRFYRVLSREIRLSHQSSPLQLIAIFSYDFFCTLEEEIRAIWKRGLSIPSVLYFTMRVCPFVWLILVLVPSNVENVRALWISSVVDSYIPSLAVCKAGHKIPTVKADLIILGVTTCREPVRSWSC